ncbi:sentrin-specific protease 8-like protein [Leptotrombidium deliense]|uniref:Sentrin-specific protease 8-like protein n=1 Tax=Leptotrombidium deliense TaxID=299467 RepID=A0A443SM97_9ACAR|nr:sentrin-specific protease 8-like protein [Leptotrombidium deliense]
MTSEDDIVLSYCDTLLRKSDVALLNKGQWINDNLIAFWFDYLENEVYKNVKERVLFISPQVVHFIKSGTNHESNRSEIEAMVDSCKMNEKQIILLPINDCLNFDSAGGSHWSLLVFNSWTQVFEHYDSHSGSVNRSHAEQIVTILYPLLTPGREIDFDLDLNEMECTQQSNGYDCGIHVISNADAVCMKIFRNDDRHICEIASRAVVKEMRQKLIQLISDLKNQASK